MTVLALTLDGELRIRQLNSTKAVVEIRNGCDPESWTYCVWRSQSIEKSWELFNNQSKFHATKADLSRVAA